MLKHSKVRARNLDTAPSTPKSQILGSLEYLASTCSIKECRAILQLSLDLCTRCSSYEEEGQRIPYKLPSSHSKEGLSAALTFLRCEARRNRMGDFETIIEATRTLIDYFLIHDPGTAVARKLHH